MSGYGRRDDEASLMAVGFVVFVVGLLAFFGGKAMEAHEITGGPIVYWAGIVLVFIGLACMGIDAFDSDLL